MGCPHGRLFGPALMAQMPTYTYHLRLGAVTCTYRVCAHTNKQHKCVHEAIASRYIHACLTINIKLEKMVLLLPVKHKLHVRNRVVSRRKPRRRHLLITSNAMLPCGRDSWILQYIGSHVPLFLCSFRPSSLFFSLFLYQVKVGQFAI